MTRLCFVDVETTGTEPAIHELWEIGLIVRNTAEPGSPDLEYAWHVYPDLGVAEPRALQVNGFYNRCKATGRGTAVVLRSASVAGDGRRMSTRSVHEVAKDLARLVDGATVAAVNVDFDVAFLAKFLRSHGQCPTWDYHKVEALSLAAGHLHLPPPWTSTTITEALRLPPEWDRHTGLGDARIVRDIYDRVYAPAA